MRSNPRFLMRFGGCVNSFNGVLFEFSCTFVFALDLWFSDYVSPLSINREGEAINLGARLHLNLSQFSQNVGGVHELCSTAERVSLVEAITLRR